MEGGRGRAGEKRLVENVNKGHNWERLVLLGKHGHRHSITDLQHGPIRAALWGLAAVLA